MRISPYLRNPTAVSLAVGFTACVVCGLWHWRVVSNGHTELERLRSDNAARQSDCDSAVRRTNQIDSHATSDRYLNHSPADHVHSIIHRLEQLGVSDRSVTTQQPRDFAFARAIPTQASFRASLPAVFDLLGWLRAQEQVIRLERLQISRADAINGDLAVSMQLVAWIRLPEASP